MGIASDWAGFSAVQHSICNDIQDPPRIGDDPVADERRRGLKWLKWAIAASDVQIVKQKCVTTG